MKTKTLLLSLTAALALSAAAAPAAWALETEWVATGTVYGSYDYTGVFGPADTSLDGDSFTADFYINTSEGYEDTQPGYYDEVYGGTQYGSVTPVSASLTINGVTQGFSGSDYGEAYTSVTGELTGYAQDNFNEDYLYTELFGGSGEYPSFVGQPFSITGNDSDSSFQIYNSIAGSPRATGNLIVNTFSSPGVISAAPEPSAWALLIAGTGIVGATLRLGRRHGWATA